MSDRTCSAIDCDRTPRTRGMCGRHYEQWLAAQKRSGLPLPPKPRSMRHACTVDGCEGTAEKRGWCGAHYKRWRLTGDVDAATPVARVPDRLPPHAADTQCAVTDCTKSVKGGGRGWCCGHYERWRLTGDVKADVPLRETAAPHDPDARCAAEGCENLLDKGGRGWCRSHYGRWRYHGDPLGARTLLPDDRDAFEGQVDRSGGPDACHPWTGRISRDGYGYAKAHGEFLLAHIVAWEYEKGTREPEIELDHECHNRAVRDGTCKPGKCVHRRCCNLRHIIPRTRKEHRAATAWRPSSRGKGKLTEQRIRELRVLLKGVNGRRRMLEIAERYDISLTHAYRIKRGEAWAWLPDATQAAPTSALDPALPEFVQLVIERSH